MPNDFDKVDCLPSSFLNYVVLQRNGWYFHSEVLSDPYILSLEHMRGVKDILPQLWYVKYRMIQYACYQQILKRLNRPLKLAIGLRMISWTHGELATQSALQGLPKPWRELWIPIWYNARRYSMQSHNSFDIQLCQLDHWHPEVHRQEMSTLGQSIHNNPDDVVPSKSSWQMGHNVHRDVIPFPH